MAKRHYRSFRNGGQVSSDMNHTHVEPIPGAEAITVEKVVSQHRPTA